MQSQKMIKRSDLETAMQREFSVCKSVLFPRHFDSLCYNEVSASMCPADACWWQLTTLRVPVMSPVVTILRGGSSVLWSDFVASRRSSLY